MVEKQKTDWDITWPVGSQIILHGSGQYLEAYYKRKDWTSKTISHTLLQKAHHSMKFTCLYICRMYKVHLAVIFKLYFWKTRRDKDIRYCDIVLAYRGNLWFDDTAKLEIVNHLDEVIVSQGDMHIHCKSLTEIQCSVLCTYRQDLQSQLEMDLVDTLAQTQLKVIISRELMKVIYGEAFMMMMMKCKWYRNS